MRHLIRSSWALAVLAVCVLAPPASAVPSVCEKVDSSGKLKYQLLKKCKANKGQTEVIDLGDVAAGYAFVLTVAKSGGQFTSVADALDSISDASADTPYLVWVAPGVYDESALVEVDGFVHLRGSGRDVTVIRSTRSNNTPSEAAATLSLADQGQVSDLTVLNQGTGTYDIAVYMSGAERTTRMRNVLAEVDGDGGVGHYAVYLNDAQPTIEDSILRASGAVGFGTAVNGALGVVNVAGGFPQPLIRGSRLIGGNNNPDGLSCAGNSGTGFAIQGANAAPWVVDSFLCGDRRAIFLGVNGIGHFTQSEIWASSTGGSFLIETTGSATAILVHGGVFYVGNKYTGTGGLVCTGMYKANFTPATDGTTSGTACD